MNTINKVICSEFEVKGSKFLGFLMPYSFYDNQLKELKNTHPKAVHFVYAYRKIQSGQIHEGFSDDGEPRGSSGMPVLNIMRREGLIDSAVIVVRYFGGVLLGVGGLMKAYGKSILLCVDLAKKTQVMIPFEFFKTISLQCPYKILRKIEYLAKNLDLMLEKKDFMQNSIKINLSGSIKGVDTFLNIYRHDLGY
ncbi:YigZ family protein [Helicobacter sp. 13S00477-4]|uniref:YigZ family protein n=1 Tax=Helicobacter sp. 13S00477-4 TaxID=1905759 RepID=UPI000BA66C87|nr:YigZ family protein [Helicobacter sp. 13S00477-4]PAF50523.1 hypothetical protein BKH44_07760 [Helicobacter sp. 13S00477-4]